MDRFNKWQILNFYTVLPKSYIYIYKNHIILYSIKTIFEICLILYLTMLKNNVFKDQLYLCHHLTILTKPECKNRLNECEQWNVHYQLVLISYKASKGLSKINILTFTPPWYVICLSLNAWVLQCLVDSDWLSILLAFISWN